MAAGSDSQESLVKALRHPRLWVAPIVVVGIMMSLLATLYLGSVLDPSDNLHDFPIALVNQDEGEVLDDGTRQLVGDQIVAGLVDNVPKDKVDLQQIGWAQADSLMRDGKLYGAIVIPSDFTKRLLILAKASVAAGDVEKPVLTVYANPRAGTYAGAIVGQIGEQAMARVNKTVGENVVKQVNQQVPPEQLSGASRLVLAEPINVRDVQFNPLPAKTGTGLSAFYYTLLLVLAGFTGAMIIHSLVDSHFGFAPTEYGPWYVHEPNVGLGRFHTLLVKWVIVGAMSVIVSAIYVGIGRLLGMPMDHAWLLFLFGTFAIFAIGVTATSVLALFGTSGLLVNLIVFIVLGLPSSGATVPIEASPRFFAWLAEFEPMHQVYLGVRAILYFDARGNAGLQHGAWMTLLGLVIGVVVGVVSTRLYDRRGYTRAPRTA